MIGISSPQIKIELGPPATPLPVSLHERGTPRRAPPPIGVDARRVGTSGHSVGRSPRWHPPFAISLALGPGIQLLGSTTEPPMQDGRGWEQSGRDLSTVRCLAGLTIDPGEVGGHETSRSRNRFMTDIDSILAERKVFLTRF